VKKIWGEFSHCRLPICDLQIKKNRLMSAVFFSIILLVSAPVLNAHPWDFLPADNEIAGWVEDTADIYVEIPDTATLYSLYNGGAGLYISYGFVEAVKKGYTNNGEEVHIVIYEMVSADSALSLYNGLAVGLPTAVAIDTIGDSARLAATLFRTDIEVLIGQYLYRINVRKSDAQHQVGVEFARVIESKINDTPIRFIAQALPDNSAPGLVIDHKPGEQTVEFRAAEASRAALFRINGKEEYHFRLSRSTGFTWHTAKAEPGVYLAVIESKHQTYVHRITILK
jgi:hypothetical protein